MRDFGLAIPDEQYRRLQRHLDRADGQEELCFFLWKMSAGAKRDSALVVDLVLPGPGDRHVHGNVSFESAYFLRACRMASRVGAGVGLVHSHPGGSGWQEMSQDDVAAERGHARQAAVLTEQSLVGVTWAGRDGVMSCRRWTAERGNAVRQDASVVRVVGGQLLTFMPMRATSLVQESLQRRSIQSWGWEAQRSLASLNVVVVGAGSVGAQVVESLARTGFGRVTIMDFDRVKTHNLDRLLHANHWHVRLRAFKAAVALRAARRSATHPSPQFDAMKASACEVEGIARLKDADLVFSCVDRPAARATLNALAYAHLIPVVDGGVMVDPGRTRIRGAEWRSHVAAPGRKCLQCLGQYDPALVQADRDGLLDDPSYLSALPEDHSLRRGENVYAFSSAAAAHMVLAALRMLLAPAGVADVGAELGHFATGTSDLDISPCQAGCQFPSMIATGDASGRPVAARHVVAERERAEFTSTLSRLIARRGRPNSWMSTIRQVFERLPRPDSSRTRTLRGDPPESKRASGR